jgi:hypothetical protein
MGDDWSDDKVDRFFYLIRAMHLLNPDRDTCRLLLQLLDNLMPSVRKYLTTTDYLTRKTVIDMGCFFEGTLVDNSLIPMGCEVVRDGRVVGIRLADNNTDNFYQYRGMVLALCDRALHNLELDRPDPKVIESLFRFYYSLVDAGNIDDAANLKGSIDELRLKFRNGIPQIEGRRDSGFQF